MMDSIKLLILKTEYHHMAMQQRCPFNSSEKAQMQVVFATRRFGLNDGSVVMETPVHNSVKSRKMWHTGQQASEATRVKMSDNIVYRKIIIVNLPFVLGSKTEP